MKRKFESNMFSLIMFIFHQIAVKKKYKRLSDVNRIKNDDNNKANV